MLGTFLRKGVTWTWPSTFKAIKYFTMFQISNYERNYLRKGGHLMTMLVCIIIYTYLHFLFIYTHYLNVFFKLLKLSKLLILYFLTTKNFYIYKVSKTSMYERNYLRKGGHLNPAVSVAVATLGKFPWWKVSTWDE